MVEQLPAVDRSLWRYYRDNGKGFAARRAKRGRPAADLENGSEREKVKHAAQTLRGGRTPPSPPPPGRERTAGEAAVDRARQALSGLLLKEGAGDAQASPSPGETTAERQVREASDETLQRMAGFFSTARTVPPSSPALRALDEELAKRGISLQLSGKVNNVYLSGAQSTWTVDASAGSDAGGERKAGGDAGAARRYNNFGQVLGRAAKNFILGH